MLSGAKSVSIRTIFSKAFLLPFFLIVAVLGSILAGYATPTEAAAIGAMGATILTIAQGKFNLKILIQEPMH